MSQFLEGSGATADGGHDGRVVDVDDAGRGERGTVRDVGHEEVDRLIRVDRPKRVLAKRDRQPRAPHQRKRRRRRCRRLGRRLGRLPRFGARAVAAAAGRRDVLPTTPYVARALAIRDEHAQSGYRFEHRGRVSLRLVERIFFLFGARTDRVARRRRRGGGGGRRGGGGGGGRRRGRRVSVLVVLVHGVVERRPDEDLQLGETFFDDAQDPFVLPRGLIKNERVR